MDNIPPDLWRMADTSDQLDPRTFSEVLEDVGRGEGPRITLEELVDAFAERGFGALLLLLGLVSAVIGAVPGTTTVLGLPILLIAVQLVIRRDQLWLPRRLLQSGIDRARYRTAVGKLMKPLRQIERLSSPRLSIMTTDASEMLIGVACVLLCCVLILPIWGGNLAPSLAIAVFGFGLMQRDGVVILIGWAVVALSIAVLAWLGTAVVETAISLFQSLPSIG